VKREGQGRTPEIDSTFTHQIIEKVLKGRRRRSEERIEISEREKDLKTS